MKDFDEAGFKDKVKPLILKENAMRLLGLGKYAQPGATQPA
jgi:predicted TIM-barrel fold metal-dependent hydrolase